MSNCKGFTVKSIANNTLMETLYAECDDGRVLSTGVIPASNHFDKSGRTWSAAAAVPADAEYIGDYPIPGAMPERP